jgi:hypothetical protein
LTDETFADHLHRAHVDPNFSVHTGIRLDRAGDLLEILEKHILDHSIPGKNVLMISEAALDNSVFVA